MIPTLAECQEYLDIMVTDATTMDGLQVAIATAQIYVLINIAHSLERLASVMEAAKEE